MRSAIRLKEVARRVITDDEPPLGARRASRGVFFVPNSRISARKYLTIEAARRLHQGAGLLAAEAWLENAHAYYPGEARRGALLPPLLVATVSLFANLHGATDRSRTSSVTRGLALLAVVFAGVPEIGLRVRAARNPHGRGWRALWPAGPLGGDSAELWLSGLLGLFAERVRNTAAHRSPMLFGVQAGRVVGLATAIGFIAASRGAGPRSLRGIFQDPFMGIALILPSAAASLVARASLDPRAPAGKTTPMWLWLTAGAGMVATGLRAYRAWRAAGSGARAWGGGPRTAAVPVPLRSTALALAGLAALGLLDDASYPGSP